MPLSDFAFVVDYDPARDYPTSVQALVLQKARETFGDKAKVVTLLPVASGAIRYFKNRGIPVKKTAGRFFISDRSGKTREIVRATIDVPMEFLIRQNGGTPGAVDLTELELPSEGQREVSSNE